MQKNVPGLGNVTIGDFAPLRAYIARARLLKVIAPMLPKVMPMLKGLAEGEKVELAKLDIDKALPLLAAVLDQIEPDELPELFRELLQTTSVTINVTKGKKQVSEQYDLCDEGRIDLVFAGRDHLLLPVCGMALKELFAGFRAGSTLDRSAPPAPAA
jgi:hypothetical protein